MHKYIYTFRHIDTHTHIYIYIFSYIHIYILVYIFTYIIHIYAWIHIHSYIFTVRINMCIYDICNYWLSIWPHVAFFWNPGWRVNAVAVWILGPLSRAASCKIGGLLTIRTKFRVVAGQVTDDLTPGTSQTQGIFVQLRKAIWISLFLKLADLKLRKVLQLSDSRLSGPPDPEGTEDCHVCEWIEVRSGAVYLCTFGGEVRILHLPWRRWTFPWLGVQITAEDSLVWISFCGPSCGCRGRGCGDWGHAYVSRFVRTQHFETSLDSELW